MPDPSEPDPSADANPGASDGPPPEPKPTQARLTLADEKEAVRVLYYGDPGKTKTTSALAMARLGKVIAIDSEAGMKPGALRRQGIPIENIEPWRDIEYSMMLQLLWDVKDRIAKGEEIVGIVWDSMTATLPIFIDALVKTAVRKAERSGQVREAWKTYQDDYGDMTNQVRELYRMMRDLPIHLAITAHVRKGKDEDGMVEIGPNVTPALQGDLFAFSDIVINMRAIQAGETTLYTGVTVPTGRFKAKDRYGALPANMVTPTFDRIVGYVEDKIDLDNDTVQIEARAALAQAASTPTNQTTDDEADVVSQED